MKNKEYIFAPQILHTTASITLKNINQIISSSAENPPMGFPLQVE